MQRGIILSLIAFILIVAGFVGGIAFVKYIAEPVVFVAEETPDATAGENETPIEEEKPLGKVSADSDFAKLGIGGSYSVSHFIAPTGEWDAPKWTVEFLDGGVSAKVCNTMNGRLTIVEGTISVESMVSTKMACEDDLMKAETAFQQLFKNGAAVISSDESVVLVSEDGEYHLELTPTAL